MIVTRTPMTINKVVLLSVQVHLISVKKNKVSCIINWWLLDIMVFISLCAVFVALAAISSGIMNKSYFNLTLLTCFGVQWALYTIEQQLAMHFTSYTYDYTEAFITLHFCVNYLKLMWKYLCLILTYAKWLNQKSSKCK